MATLKAIHNGPPRRLHPEPRASASIPRAFQKRGGGEIGGGDVDGGEAAARSGRTLRRTNAVRSVRLYLKHAVFGWYGFERWCAHL